LKIALIADIHEDVVSLKDALRIAENETCDHIVCLGDIIGYPYRRAAYNHTRNASECISLVKNNCSCVVKGNHDIFHTSSFPKHATGFRFPKEWYRLSDDEKLSLSNGRVWHYSDDSSLYLSDSEIEYLNSLPEFEVHNCNGLHLSFSHYLYPNITGYESSLKGVNADVKTHFLHMATHNSPIGFVGHIHPEGVGICYETNGNITSAWFGRFRFFTYGSRNIRDYRCVVGLPALADNGRENGFSVFDTVNRSLNTISLNPNRRAHL